MRSLFQLKKRIYIVIYFLIYISGVYSQYNDEPFDQEKVDKVFYIDKISSRPVIDGKLNEQCWQTNNYIDDFIQDEPVNQASPSEPTKVMIFYDNESLYIGAILYDSKLEKIPKKIIKRDDWENSSMTDWFSIEIDSYHDHHNAFEFLVSASGSQFDDIIYDDVARDGNWDEVWYSDISFDEDCWYVEMEIPFNVLRFSNKSEQIWGINLNRYLSRNNEQISWVALDREINGIVSHFGHIQNLNELPYINNIEIKPYITIGTTNYNDYELSDTNKINFGFSQLDSISIVPKIGVDIKKHIHSNSILDITINPDFGQVEADPENINLSYYEIYYNEKRPFFMESSTLFDTPIEIFYSRKIGMNHKYVSGKWNDKKDALVKAAVKLSGKTNNGISYGIISAVTTDEENGDWVYKMQKGKGSSFLINRFTKDFFSGNSYVGFMSTHYKGNYNNSNVVSIDALTYLFENKLYMDFQTVWSQINEENGLGFSFDSYYTSKDNFTSYVDYQYYDKKFDISRVGYLKRNNLSNLNLKFEYVKNDWVLSNFIRTTNIELIMNYKENLDKVMLDRYIGLNILLDFINNFYFSSSIAHQFNRSDDRILFDYKDQVLQSDSPMATLPSQSLIGFGLGTDPSKMFSFNGMLYFVENEFSDRTIESLLQFSYNTKLSNLTVNWIRKHQNQSFYWLDIFDEIVQDNIMGQQISDTTSHYIFSAVSRYENRINLRYNLNMSKDASIQFYSEYYINDDSYSNYSELMDYAKYPVSDTEFINDLINSIYITEEELVGGVEPTLGNLVEPNDDIFYYPNSNRLNLSLVINWRYNPGSNIYFVLTRSKELVGREYDSFSEFVNYIPKGNELTELFRDYSVFVKLDYKINI